MKENNIMPKFDVALHGEHEFLVNYFVNRDFVMRYSKKTCISEELDRPSHHFGVGFDPGSEFLLKTALGITLKAYPLGTFFRIKLV